MACSYCGQERKYNVVDIRIMHLCIEGSGNSDGMDRVWDGEVNAEGMCRVSHSLHPCDT